MAKIVLIDDEELVRRVMRVLIEDEGHQVLDAPGGEPGVKLVMDEEPDLVLLDLVMPGEDGIEICRAIKSLRPDTKVIVLTSRDDPASRNEARGAGADEFTTKPVSSPLLMRMIADLTSIRG